MSRLFSLLLNWLSRWFSMPWVRLGIVLLPLGLGGMVALYVQATLHPLPILAFRLDVGTAAMLSGLLLTLLLGAYFFGDESRAWFARKEVKAMLQNLEESRRQFLRRLDHEIKNPLTGLQAALVNMSEAPDEIDRARAAENARQALERLRRLLADLRKLAELEERSLECLPVDIPALLEEVTEAVRTLPSAQERPVHLMIARVPWPFSPVRGDRDLLGLAFYNLIENAVKFSTPQDTVEIRALEDGDTVLVEVADSGPGIHPADLPKIFEELYRGMNARGVEGSGLGLALTRRIVLLHGGALEVRSRQDAPRGTVFSVRLPVARG